MTKASILELLTSDRKQRFREQRGSVVARQDGFYIRYYKDGDGGVRIKHTERLCDLGTTAAKVKLLQRSHMSAVNNIRHEELQSPTQAPPITIGGFWKSVYWPWAEANKRESTQRGYQYVWKLYVGPELETRTFETYTTVDACELLDQMAKRLDKIGCPRQKLVQWHLLSGRSQGHDQNQSMARGCGICQRSQTQAARQVHR